MMTTIVILALIVLLGPLRRWAGRHWALLTSVGLAAVAGWWLGSLLSSFSANLSYAPIIGAIVFAIEALHHGPSFLRKLEEDGRKE